MLKLGKVVVLLLWPLLLFRQEKVFIDSVIERYPIAFYLISVAIINYEQFSNWFHYSPNDSMEELNYVISEKLSSAKENISLVIGMLDVFDQLFGLYLFINEKCGHTDFGRRNAMEHQTMTSITTYN